MFAAFAPVAPIPAWMIIVYALTALVLIAPWDASNWRLTAWVIGGMLGAAVVLTGVTLVMIRSVRTLLPHLDVAWRFGFTLDCVGALLVTWTLIALAFIDLDTQLLPDSLTLPLLWLGLLFSLVNPDSAVFADPRSAVIGAIAGYLSLWSVYQGFRLATGKEGMGYGDFKLLAALGAWLGWQMLLPIILLSAGVGLIAAVAMMVFLRHDRRVPIPFGPYLAIAGFVAMIWGDGLLGMYLAASGLQ